MKAYKIQLLFIAPPENNGAMANQAFGYIQAAMKDVERLMGGELTVVDMRMEDQ